MISRPQPAWRRVSIPKTRDIRLLLPPNFPQNERFETKKGVAERNAFRVDALRNKLPDISDEIDLCDPKGAPCNFPGCASCARDYRVYAASELLNIADQYEGPHDTATIHLASVKAGRLVDVDLAMEHDKLRKRLRRVGFGRSILAGGTEAAWKVAEGLWRLHVHLLAIGVSPERWAMFREAIGETGTDTSVKVRELKEEVLGIGYLTKFSTYHRPLACGRPSNSPVYPLPAPRLVELVAWWDKYDFEDFAFLFGARRRGGHFVPEY